MSAADQPPRTVLKGLTLLDDSRFKFQSKAHPTNGLDYTFGFDVFKLFTQITHIDIHYVVIIEVVLPPDMLNQLSTTECLTWITDEAFQMIKLMVLSTVDAMAGSMDYTSPSGSQGQGQ